MKQPHPRLPQPLYQPTNRPDELEYMIWVLKTIFLSQFFMKFAHALSDVLKDLCEIVNLRATVAGSY